MSEPFYFQPFSNYFWQWEEEDPTREASIHNFVAVLPDGSTIAYGTYLFDTVTMLAEQGLPPFGSLLLAIIATNDSMDDAIEKVRASVANLFDIKAAHQTLEEAVAFLRRLASLPKQYRSREARKLLLQTLFESGHNIIAAREAKRIPGMVADLSFSTTALGCMRKQENRSFDVCHREFRCIALLHRKFPDVDTIISRMTGVPVIEEELLPDPEPEQLTSGPTDLIQELIADHRTFPVGALIKSLWAGLQIPFHSNLPGGQPLGGISDLTNKGDFDKLLISEFANDDMVLLSRLANNEALYLQREAPPQSDKLNRIILIDVSLKNWGTPRLLAYAVLLAVARHPKTSIPCRAFAIGDGCTELYFDSVNEVIRSLQRLEGSLHAAGGLTQFFEQTDLKNSEVFLISSADALAHAAVQKGISDHYSRFRYWVHTESDGTITLYKNQNNSRKVLQQIRLPLEKLWQQEPKPIASFAKPPEHSTAADFPLLFPHTSNLKHLLAAPDGEIFIIDGEKRLFRQYNRGPDTHQKGMQVILPHIQFKTTDFAIGQDEKGRRWLLCFRMDNRDLYIYNLATHQRRQVVFNEWRSSPYPEFFFYRNAFYYMNNQYYWQIHVEPELKIERFKSEKDSLLNLYQPYQLQKESGEAKRNFRRKSYEVLRNVKAVFINKNGNLVFNKHELLINSSGIIKLQLTSSDARAIVYQSTFDRDAATFYFDNGSGVKVDRSGMLILKTKDLSHEPSFEVVLLKCGLNKLDIVRVIKDFTKKSLVEAKTIADQENSVVGTYLHNSEALKLKTGIERSGGKAMIKERAGRTTVYIPSVVEHYLGVATDKEFAGNEYYFPDKGSLQKMSSALFFEKYITPFIKDIQRYGA